MQKLMVPVAALLLAAGCSATPSRTISGQLDVTQMHPANAQVIAISSAGRVFRAPVAANGAFSISLPTAANYTIRFANATSVAGRYDAFATLTPHRAGVATRWFSLTGGANILLGRVARPGTTAAARPAGLSTAADGANDGQDASAGDAEQEDDSAEACDLSGGADDIDVESENDLDASVDSDHDGTADADDDHDDRSACTSAQSGADCALSDDETQELEDDADKACTAGGGAPAPTAVPGVSG